MKQFTAAGEMYTETALPWARLECELSRSGEPDNDFRPGDSASLNFGLRYVGTTQWVPQLQVNLLHRSADRGALADALDSAGTVAYLSPGVTVHVLSNLHVFGFLQVPVYSRLDGYQLKPRWTASLGFSFGLR